MGLKDTILTAKDIKEETFNVPEWKNVKVTLRGLSDEQMGSYQAKTTALRMKQQRGEQVDMEVAMRHRRAELVVQCLLDPDTGKRIFTDGEATKLAQKNAGIINGLFVLAQSLSGMDRTFDQQVRDAEKNSDSARN